MRHENVGEASSFVASQLTADTAQQAAIEFLPLSFRPHKHLGLLSTFGSSSPETQIRAM